MIQGSVQACSKSPAMGGPSLSPHQSSAHPGPDRAAGGTNLADLRQEGSAISGRTQSCGAFMCGCFGDIGGVEHPALSCARHALRGVCML